jgi:mono/diheme cytochrome c family protein
MSRLVTRSRLPLALAALAAATLPVHAQLPEDNARQVAQEVRLLVTEGTAVIGDLQPAINGGKAAKEQVSPDVLTGQFRIRYEKAAGHTFDEKEKGVMGDARRSYVHAFNSVVTRYQVNLTHGGQDAFVPAFFRAQVLKEFNQLMQGKAQVYATNRDAELINSDWAVHKVMKGSSLASEVERLMATGALEPVVKRSGGAVMGYYPMKLAPSCVACHAQNGLKQTEGGFGGALVAEIPVK